MNLRVAIAAVLLFAAAFGLYLASSNRPLHNGDEVIYAEYAKQMAQTGDWATLRWQGEAQVVKPPASLWAVAVAFRIAGPSERVMIVVCALESALGVVFTFLLGVRLFGFAAGLAGGGTLAVMDRYFVYASYMESEHLLVIFVAFAVLCWELARERPRWLLGFGACLGGAIMTKQAVGFLPLFLPLLDVVLRRPVPWRRFGVALAVAGAIALPWHLIEWHRLGTRFWSDYVGRHVVGRLGAPVHEHRTTPLYYLHMLWAREGLLILIAPIGLVWTAVRRQWLPFAWILSVLVPLSIVASRHDYYALLAYPPLALAAAAVATNAARRVGPYLGVALVAAFAIYNVPPTRASGAEWDAQMRGLSQIAAEVSTEDDTLYVIDQFAYLARFHSGRTCIRIRLETDPQDAAAEMLPGPVRGPEALGELAATDRRWFAIAPRRDAPRLSALGPVYALAATSDYLLLSNRAVRR